MEWTTVQHLDLRHAGRSSKPLQPHAAAFHPTQALVSAAIGTYIIEFDAYTGSKIASVDIGSPVVRMAYSPTAGHSLIAILEDCTIRSCDFDSEQTCVLHSPEKRSEQISIDTEVHLALTPLQPVVFFGFHKKMSVTVVGTVVGGKAPTKIKTDLKKPIVNLACHPRLPALYVAYQDGLIRAYNIHTYAVHYTLQLDNTIKLLGAGAFAFHPTLEWIFVGDRRGTVLAWDVSTERPLMIGITQVGSQPITSVSWLPMLRLLVTLSRDGSIQVWKTRTNVNPNRPPMQANFFEPAAIESIDIPRILSQQGGEAVYPLPRIRGLEVHPKLNLATLLFANMTGGDNRKNRAAYTREGRKQLFAVLQSARGSSASVLKEKLAALGSSGILADHQLQAQLQEHHAKGESQLTISDIARKAFLYSHFMEGHAKSAPISRLPLITIMETKHQLRDFPICQPIHLELNFFSKENRVLHYPVRAFYIEGPNLMAYNLTSGSENIYKKLYATIPGNVDVQPKYISYSKKQHIFLVAYEISVGGNEVVMYWENTDPQFANSKVTTVKGSDAAFVGPTENQFVVLDDDKTALSLYLLPGAATQALEKNGSFNENQSVETEVASIKGPVQFMFESEVDRIFSTPLESTVMFASHGDQIGFGKLITGYRLPSADGHYIPTKAEGRKFIRLKVNETVLQVQWQETLRGFVAGILTTLRVLIVTADLDVLACSSANICVPLTLPYYRSLLWLGPALLFSTSTSVNVLGWDGKVRTILSTCMPNAVLLGALNDRLLLVNTTEINVRQKKKFEIKNCLVGLLEPLLIGFATMQQHFEQKLDLSEVLYQITSRFDSLRITPRSLDILARGPPVCGDLAVSLSQSGLQFTQVHLSTIFVNQNQKITFFVNPVLFRAQVLRGIYAIKALRFSTALSALKDEFLRSRDYPRCPPTSHLFHRFRQLGYACIRYGQFDSAKETFEVIADYQSMLDLFICHLNPSAMRYLAQKLEEEGSDPELRRHCERILRVRSTGWTQGIFANFAAESMVPKGREWGGGNWEIKTPMNLKDIPQWALAAEVMPYMRTDDGTIPSIVTDHIGVYLGLMKGRGNVVEVREDSLVRALKSDTGTGTGTIKDNGAHMPSVSSDPKIGSLMGLETLSQQSTASSATTDAQAKAEEEFKKSLYGSAGGSSSDEEEGGGAASKAKKLHIRIRDKPASSATVDVNKIKEATKQLGVPMGRTKSLTGSSPDLGLLMPPQSAPPVSSQATSVPADLFGTSSLVMPPALPPPPASGRPGVGVAVGPIPEDFFQNTISSVHVAASLPPAGTILSRLDPNAQNNMVPNAQASAAVAVEAEVGLPDGGVPPPSQVMSQQQQQSVPYGASIGLPDGGVPPQSLPEAAAPSQPQQIQMVAGATVASQPLDLSSLEGPGSETSGIYPARSASPPKAVRPGQVPRGAAAAVCFKTGLTHLEQNQLSDALSCFDEAFLALAKDQSRGADIKAQATICAQYKIAVTLLQEINRLQKVQGPSAISAKDEMARLSRHLGSLPLLAKHRINCIRTAIKRNMDVQNFAYAKQMLELLLSKAPAGKQDELRSLIDMCVQRGLTNKSIDPLEDPSQFCAATLSRLSTIGYDVCDLCGAKFSALSAPGCIICGMGSIKRSDAIAGPVPSPFG
ncbi:Transducin/WD40 repeat-like superfamily protein [Striga hermonthica]|uniref:Transducin/WD40 repeat-like superfamily protein n=1 Tax=Striga hermonthica TaxID=68872 RepID=A0A9N7P064_STRHE|nr:Transducin/WD40 repeat-like superfamily protein [Striga hermonthica]